jgi:hypothetical protein
MIYDETTFLHPESPDLVDKLKSALRAEPGKSSRELGGLSADGPSVSRIIHTMEDYFGT